MHKPNKPILRPVVHIHGGGRRRHRTHFSRVLPSCLRLRAPPPPQLLPGRRAAEMKGMQREGAALGEGEKRGWEWEE